MRVVVDTNVFISGLISTGPSRLILNLLEENAFHCVMTPALLKELKKTLRRPKFTTLFKDININELIKTINNKALFIAAPSVKIEVCRDPQDNIVLEAAVAANASVIVTGDKDLLVLNPFRHISILSPKDFLKRLK